MSQHDFDIANQTASSARADINNALQALASCNSGNTEPNTTYANMLWYETDTNLLKMRNEADTGWISLFYVDQTNNLVHILDDTEVANTSGTKIGVLGDHADSTWTTGTNTEKRLVSPAQLKGAIDALSSGGLGDGQSWSNPSRSLGTTYQNTTGKPIMANIAFSVGNNAYIQVSSNNSTWITLSAFFQSGLHPAQSIVVPNNHYYRVTGSSTTITLWAELS